MTKSRVLPANFDRKMALRALNLNRRPGESVCGAGPKLALTPSAAKDTSVVERLSEAGP